MSVLGTLRRAPVAFALVTFALVWPLPAGTMAAEPPARISLVYDVWTGGFNSFDLEAHLSRAAERYWIAVNARTKNTAGRLLPYRLNLDAWGVNEAAGPRPRRYRSASSEPERERRRELIYGAEGLEAYTNDGNPETEALAAMAEDNRRSTLDPASAIYAVIGLLGPGRRCAGRVPVFDGKRRYDLSLQDLGTSDLRPGGPGLYSGPAALCRVAIERRDGIRKDQGSRFPSRVDIWSAVLSAGAPAVPVRLEGRGKYGAMVAHLVGAQIDGTLRQVRR